MNRIIKTTKNLPNLSNIKQFTCKELIDLSEYHETEFAKLPHKLLLMDDPEKRLLWSLAKYIFPDNANYLEIGTYAGYSALLVKDSNPTLNIKCVDPYFEGSEASEATNSEISMDSLYYKTLTLLNSNNIQLIRGESEKILSCFEDNYFDIIFIDGDHKYESIEKDILNSYPKVKNNGIMFGHDTCFSSITEALKKYIIEPEFKDIIYNTPGQFGFWFARVSK
jgi:predicted O-methyltransferase YrrM